MVKTLFYAVPAFAVLVTVLITILAIVCVPVPTPVIVVKLFPVPNPIPVHVLTQVSNYVRSLIIFPPPFLLMSLSLFLFLLWHLSLSLSVFLFLFRRQVSVSGCFISPHCFPDPLLICQFLQLSAVSPFMCLLMLLFFPQDFLCSCICFCSSSCSC